MVLREGDFRVLHFFESWRKPVVFCVCALLWCSSCFSSLMCNECAAFLSGLRGPGP
jgi:hypothetical protein